MMVEVIEKPAQVSSAREIQQTPAMIKYSTSLSHMRTLYLFHP